MLTPALLEAGYDAIILSVDAPMLGMRLNEYRNSFAMPAGITCPNLEAPDSDSMEGGNRSLEYGNILSNSSNSVTMLM